MVPFLVHRRTRAGAVLLLLAAALAVFATEPAPAIVGGTPVTAGQWPWMAGLLDSSLADAGAAQFCGGVVIGRRRVLTAAHCVEEASASEIDVLVGRTRLTTHDGRRVPVSAISVFPGYFKAQPGLDAAVLTVDRDLGVEPLRLARASDAAAWAPGTPAVTLGWGRLNARVSPGGNKYYSDRLRQLVLPVTSDDACESAFGIGTRSMPYRPSWSLCAGNGDGIAAPCFGDSGGPLVVATPAGWLDAGILIGGDDCAARGYYTMFTRVDRIARYALAASLPSD